MPTHLDHSGERVEYHTIPVRFTETQFSILKSASERTGKSISEILRVMVDRQADVSSAFGSTVGAVS